MFVIKLRNKNYHMHENYYLHEGPSGYGFGRSKSRAKVFPTRKSAVDFSKVVSGDMEVVSYANEKG